MLIVQKQAIESRPRVLFWEGVDFHQWRTRTVLCISGKGLIKVSGLLRWWCQENDHGKL